MRKSNQITKLLGLIIVICLASFDVTAQACGYSFVTLFAENGEGESIKNVKIKVKFWNDSHPGTKIYWDDKLGAHIIQHGLCQEHRNVIVTASAQGYGRVAQKIDLRFGSHGYELRLVRKESSQKGILTELSCTDGSRQCAKSVVRN